MRAEAVTGADELGVCGCRFSQPRMGFTLLLLPSVIVSVRNEFVGSTSVMSATVGESITGQTSRQRPQIGMSVRLHGHPCTSRRRPQLEGRGMRSGGVRVWPASHGDGDRSSSGGGAAGCFA